LRFRDQDIVFAGGAKGQNLDILTANPVNYFHVISNAVELPRLVIDGKLFLPASNHRKRNGKLPLVMVVPGSLGVAPSHLKHAETVVSDGFAAFVLDSFGARGVTSTVANQTQPPALTTCWRPGRCCLFIPRSTRPGSARKATAAAARRC
jgi:dienelactone hydrolase